MKKTQNEKAKIKDAISVPNMAEGESIKYACKQCDYQSTRQYHLKTHMQSQHEGVKYACDQCDYQATQQFHLTSHIQRKHS